jgi:hypothetical protein
MSLGKTKVPNQGCLSLPMTTDLSNQGSTASMKICVTIIKISCWELVSILKCLIIKIKVFREHKMHMQTFMEAHRKQNKTGKTCTICRHLLHHQMFIEVESSISMFKTSNGAISIQIKHGQRSWSTDANGM